MIKCGVCKATASTTENLQREITQIPKENVALKKIQFNFKFNAECNCALAHSTLPRLMSNVIHHIRDCLNAERDCDLHYLNEMLILIHSKI